MTAPDGLDPTDPDHRPFSPAAERNRMLAIELTSSDPRGQPGIEHADVLKTLRLLPEPAGNGRSADLP